MSACVGVCMSVWVWVCAVCLCVCLSFCLLYACAWVRVWFKKMNVCSCHTACKRLTTVTLTTLRSRRSWPRKSRVRPQPPVRTSSSSSSNNLLSVHILGLQDLFVLLLVLRWRLPLLRKRAFEI